MSLSSLEVLVHWANWTNIDFFFCCVTVSAFSTTAAATGMSALESCILKNKLLEGVPTTTAFILLLLSALFWPPELYRRFVWFVVDDDRIQFWNGQFIYSLSDCIYRFCIDNAVYWRRIKIHSLTSDTADKLRHPDVFNQLTIGEKHKSESLGALETLGPVDFVHPRYMAVTPLNNCWDYLRCWCAGHTFITHRFLYGT